MASIYDKSSLVLIPSGTKTGKVFSQKPVSGDGDFTFTRASAATRVNADGNIEKETQNLLLYSNQPNQWSVVSVLLTAGQAGYDGSNDAWLFDSSAGYIRNNLSLSGVYTYSIYAKQGTANGIRLRMDAGTDANVYINLTDGSEFFSNTGIDYAATSVGGGWWRISITANDSSFSNFRVYAIDAGGSTTGTIYIQDAQINQGLVAQPYQETTTAAVYGGITDNTPRLDYTDSSCPALLLEPQRTNALAYSEYFNAWNLSGGTLTPNDTTSPEGLQNASLYTEDTSTNYHRFNIAAAATNSNKVYSVYAKLADGAVNKWLTIDNGPTAWFDLENGVVGNAQGSVVIDIEPVGNGWYRCIYHNPASTTGGIYIGIAASNGGSGNHTGSGLPAFYAYGAQCEDNVTYATSYIPTYGSSVSRVADASATLTLPDALENNYTIFLELERMVPRLTNATDMISFYGSGSSRIRVMAHNPDYFRLRMYAADGSTSGSFYDTSGNFAQGNNYKSAIVYNNGTFKVFGNGSMYNSADIEIDITAVVLRQESILKQLLTFPTALTDAEAIALTTI
jgi:hypothetical protein